MAFCNTKARCLGSVQTDQTTGGVNGSFSFSFTFSNDSAEQMQLFYYEPDSEPKPDPRAKALQTVAQEWIADNPEVWETFCEILHAICATDNRPVERALLLATSIHRDPKKGAVKVNNDIRPILARIYLHEKHPEDAGRIEIRKSRADSLGARYD